jgi:hypothetical protein
MKIRSRLFKSIDGVILDARKQINKPQKNTVTPITNRSFPVKRVFAVNNVMIFDDDYGQTFTTSAHKNLVAPDPRNFPPIKQSNDAYGTLFLN